MVWLMQSLTPVRFFLIYYKISYIPKGREELIKSTWFRVSWSMRHISSKTMLSVGLCPTTSFHPTARALQHKFCAGVTTTGKARNKMCCSRCQWHTCSLPAGMQERLKSRGALWAFLHLGHYFRAQILRK